VKAKRQLRAGFSYIRRVPELWIPLVMMTIIGTLTFNFTVVVPLFVERTLHGTDADYTLLYSVLSVGSLAGALVAAYRDTIELPFVVATSTLFGVAMCVFAAAPDLPVAFLLAMFVGFASVSFMTAVTTIVQVRSDPSMRGRVLAVQAIVMLGSTPVGGPLLGLLCDSLGARAGLVLGGLAAFAAAGWGWTVSGRARRHVDPSALARPAP
jgi:predicted MFS family arabinose efflux permease